MKLRSLLALAIVAGAATLCISFSAETVAQADEGIQFRNNHAEVFITFKETHGWRTILSGGFGYDLPGPNPGAILAEAP